MKRRLNWSLFLSGDTFVDTLTNAKEKISAHSIWSAIRWKYSHIELPNKLIYQHWSIRHHKTVTSVCISDIRSDRYDQSTSIVFPIHSNSLLHVLMVAKSKIPNSTPTKWQRVLHWNSYKIFQWKIRFTKVRTNLSNRMWTLSTRSILRLSMGTNITFHNIESNLLQLIVMNQLIFRCIGSSCCSSDISSSFT